MSLIRPDYWIPHLSVYAFGVIQHQPQDAPESSIHTVAPLDYVVAIGITVGLLAIQALLLSKLLHRGRKWYFAKMKHIDSDEARAQANRTLLSLLTNAILGVLTLVSCILLFANFMMRIWALGFIVKPDDVRYGGAINDDRVNCSFGTPNCITMKPQFGTAVENLEQTTAFMMQIVVLAASATLVYRGAILFKGKVWMHALTGVPFIVLVVSTVAGVVAVYRNPYKYPRQSGWLYYRYQSNDPFISTQIAIARITPTISTTAVVALNLVFTISVIATRARICARSCISYILVESALPSAILGIALLFVPVYGAQEDQPFFYMRLARYSLRTLWVSLLILSPQVAALRAMRADRKHEEPMDEKTVIDSEAGYIKDV